MDVEGRGFVGDPSLCREEDGHREVTKGPTTNKGARTFDPRRVTEGWKQGNGDLSTVTLVTTGNGKVLRRGGGGRRK